MNNDAEQLHEGDHADAGYGVTRDVDGMVVLSELRSVIPYPPRPLAPFTPPITPRAPCLPFHADTCGAECVHAGAVSLGDNLRSCDSAPSGEDEVKVIKEVPLPAKPAGMQLSDEAVLKLFGSLTKETALAKEEQAVPTPLVIATEELAVPTAGSLSKALKNKLAAAEEENVRLQAQLDAVTAMWWTQGTSEFSTPQAKVEINSVWTNKEENQVKAKEASKAISSKILKSKLTDAEEENEKLQMQLDAALKQLASVYEATVTEPEMERSMTKPEPERERSPSAREPGATETPLTQSQTGMENELLSKLHEQIQSEVALRPQRRCEVTAGSGGLHGASMEQKTVVPFLNLAALQPLASDELSELTPCSFSLTPSSSQGDLCAWSGGESLHCVRSVSAP